MHNKRREAAKSSPEPKDNSQRARKQSSAGKPEGTFDVRDMNYSQEEEDEIYTKILEGEGVPQKVYDDDDFDPDPVDSDADEGGHSTVTFSLRNLNYVKNKLFEPEIKYLTDKFKEELGATVKKNQEIFEHMLDQLNKRSKDDLNVVNQIATEYQVETENLKLLSHQTREMMSELLKKIEPLDQLQNYHSALQNLSVSVWQMQHDIMKLWYDMQLVNQKAGIIREESPVDNRSRI